MADLIQVEQRLAQHGEFNWQSDAVHSADACYFQHQPADLNLFQTDVLVLSNHIGDLVPEHGFIGLCFHLTELQRDFSGVIPAILADCQQQLQQPFLQPRSDAGDHSQVEQRDLIPVSQEDVAGMRVGVEETVHQNLFQVGAESSCASAFPSISSFASGPSAVTFLPRMYSIVSTRDVVKPSIGRGTTTVGKSFRLL